MCLIQLRAVQNLRATQCTWGTRIIKMVLKKMVLKAVLIEQQGVERGKY